MIAFRGAHPGCRTGVQGIVSKISFLVTALILLLFAPIYFAVYQAQKTRRFNIGSWDKRYLENPETFSPRLEMSGPFRHEDSSVDVIGFDGRLSGRTATLQLPFHTLRSPLRIWVRSHRFGLGGTVRMSVNDVLIDDFVFTENSYPWAGIRTVIPQKVAERGALHIDLVVSGGRSPPSHLRSDIGLGIDWVEVDPMSGGAMLLPTAYEWMVAYVSLVLGAISFRIFGFSTRVFLLVLGALILAVAALTALRPVESPTVLFWLWSIFPAGIVLQRSILFAYSRSRRVLFPVLAAILSTLVALTAMEVFLRSYESWQQEQQQLPPEKLSLFEPNPEGTGSYRLKPNLDLVTSIVGSEVKIHTNSHGMPWREVSVEPSGKRRIAFFGDSFTFGSWADSVERSFVGVFEESLSSEWEVLNFGVGGYGFADVELLLAEKGIDFEPSFVVVVMYNGNDFRDTYLGLWKELLVDGTAVLNEQNLKERVPERFVNAPHTMAHPSPETSILKEWLRRLAVFRFVAPFLRMENLTVDFVASSRFVSYSFWSQFPYSEVAVRAKDVSLETLTRIDDLARTNGARLIVVALPTRDQVYSGRMSGDHYDIDLPQAYARLFAREANIPFLDLLPPLRAYVAETNKNLFVRGDTHLNNKGHLLVGRYLADWFDCCVN